MVVHRPLTLIVTNIGMFSLSYSCMLSFLRTMSTVSERALAQELCSFFLLSSPVRTYAGSVQLQIFTWSRIWQLNTDMRVILLAVKLAWASGVPHWDDKLGRACSS